MKNEVLIYDNSTAYANFFKQKLGSEFDFEKFKSLNDSEHIDFKKYMAVIFILNSEIELLDLMWIFSKTNNLLFYSKYKKINARLSEIENITLLDFNKSKSEIVENIQTNLSMASIFHEGENLMVV